MRRKHMLARREYLTPDELSDLLGLSVKTLANWRLDGRGPEFERFGNRIRYFKDAVQVWREKHRHASTQEYARVGNPKEAARDAGGGGAEKAELVERITALIRELAELENEGNNGVDVKAPRSPKKQPRGRPDKRY